MEKVERVLIQLRRAAKREGAHRGTFRDAIFVIEDLQADNARLQVELNKAKNPRKKAK